MSFQPVVFAGGLVGWRMLQNTMSRQTEVFEQSRPIKSATAYFTENIAAIQTAKELTSDRRLLEVALGAFGLQDDINNRYFIEKVLTEGTSVEGSLANKLSDKRYAAFADAFSFDTLPRTAYPGFASEITERYERLSFEVAVGEQDEAFRFALNLTRELPEITERNSSNDAQWFAVMGNPALREVFQTAFGLPSEFGQVEIDKQLEVFKDYAERRLGTDQVDQLATPEKLDEITQLFLLQNQIQQSSGLGSGSIALTLLQSAQPLA